MWGLLSSVAVSHAQKGIPYFVGPCYLKASKIPSVLKGCNKVSPEPSLLQAEPPQLSQPFLIGEVFHPSDHFCGPPLDPLQQVHVFPVLRTPELDAALQGGGVEGQNHLPRPAAHTAFDAARIRLAFWAASAHCRITASFSSTSTPKSFCAGLLSIPSSPSLS